MSLLFINIIFTVYVKAYSAAKSAVSRSVAKGTLGSIGNAFNSAKTAVGTSLGKAVQSARSALGMSSAAGTAAKPGATTGNKKNDAIFFFLVYASIESKEMGV